MLRRCVRDRADELVRPGQPRLVTRLADSRDAEVDDFIYLLAARKIMPDDVRGLEIAVDDAVRVRQLQCVTELRHNPLHVRDVEPPPRRDLVLEARPAQELHYEKRVAGRVDIEVEDGDDVGVPQPRRGAALAHETLADRRHGVIRVDHFYRDFIEQERAPRAVYRSHTAGGDDRDNLVAPVQDLARRKHVAI